MEQRGNATHSDLINKYNSLIFMIRQQILGMNTAELVQVKTVNADNTVDVLPLLRLATAQGNYQDTSVIFNIPFIKIQGGKNLLDITPEVGDIGLVVYCQRDISNIILSKAQANPASNRSYSCSDGVYVASIMSLNQQPENFIKVNSEGVNITTAANVAVNASKATINCDLQVNGQITASDIITGSDCLTASGISLQNHTHPYVDTQPNGSPATKSTNPPT